MPLLRIALLLTVVVVSISWSQNEVAQAPAGRKITFIAYSSSGKRLENCRLQSVKSSGAAHGGDAVPISDDMQIERVVGGQYKVLYMCAGRLLYDEHVGINSKEDLVVLIDRSGGDLFKFKSGFRQGLRLTWASPLERPRDSQDISWARLGHLVDGESWLRQIPGDKKQITFPAEPGIYVLTFSTSTNAVCTLLLEVMSYSSEAIVLDEQRCKVSSVAGMRVRESMPMQN